MNNDFHRIKRLPPYVFEQVNRLKAEARARGIDVQRAIEGYREIDLFLRSVRDGERPRVPAYPPSHTTASRDT